MGGVCSMVQKQVFRDQERCIYRIQESNMDFYMIIPNRNQLSLVLGLMNSVDDNKVSSISKMEDKVVIVPVLDEKVFVGIQQNQGAFFNYLDKYFSSLLNLSHRILTHNQLKLLNIIYFYSNIEYKNFRDWFIQKYQGRVQAIEISFDSVQSAVMPEMIVSSQQSIITSQPQPESVAPVVDQSHVVEKLQESPVVESTVSEEVVPTPTKEPGFVSYVLLGVMVAVLSLVFLYFII